MSSRLKLVLIALIVTASAAAAQGSSKTTAKSAAPRVATYKKDIPDSLVKSTKVSESAAAKTALGKVPNGKISSMELERENGKLIYSYDIKVAGKSGIQEVNVNAVDGSLVGDVEHESAASEAKEAAAEKSKSKTKKPPR
jgi:uncharacterized membrane protein YkoI